jgi:ABC-type dipeptide/oligopeptide/nickel transport system permease subunit
MSIPEGGLGAAGVVPAPAPDPTAAPPPARAAARWRRGERRWRLSPVLPIAILALLVIAAVFAPLLAPVNPNTQNLPDAMLPPFWMHGGTTQHLLGTDSFGRDELSRLIYGARISLSVALLAIAVAMVIGTAVGVIAGYRGGTVDVASMRFVDMILALPMLLVGLTIAIAVGPSFGVVVLVIGLLIWPILARLVRSETSLLMRSEFIRYARAIGVPRRSIIIRHILPNVVPTILVATTLQVGNVVLTEASLSFLGAGVPPPDVSWGGMISDGEALIATGWWVALFPGLLMLITVLCFNSVGDWLSHHLDPRTRGLAR